jgi:hypothetical protein
MNDRLPYLREKFYCAAGARFKYGAPLQNDLLNK